MDEIRRLKTLIDNGSNITENYNKIEKLISLEYANIKILKDKLKIENDEKEETNINDLEDDVRKFLNKNELSNSSYEEYMSLLKKINYLIDKNNKEEVKIKKIIYKDKKLKIKKLVINT